MAKRQPNGNGSIRKVTRTVGGKPRIYWEGRYTDGYDLGTGKQKQKSIYGKTQKEVQQKLKQITMDIESGKHVEPSKITLSTWLDTWISEYTGDKKYQTVKTYKHSIETHIKPSIGAVKLKDLTPPIIQSFYNELARSGKLVAEREKDGKLKKEDGKTVFKRCPLNPKTIKNIHGVLSKALSVAVDIGYLPSNPAERTTLPRCERKEIKPLTDAQIPEFMKEVEKDDYRLIFKLILFTGLRESEALGLTWDCVDFNKSEIRINKQLIRRNIKDGGVYLASTKSGKERIITVSKYVLDLLHEQKITQTTQSLYMGEAWKAWHNREEMAQALVFTMPDGSPITQSTLRHHFDRMRGEFGRPDCRLHDLRHTFAVLSLQNGDSIKTVQSNLGHATAAFTLDVYGHVSEKMRSESAERMQKYIEEVAL